MRRLFGMSALVVGVSVLLTTTASAKDPEGRVVNSKPKRVVKRLVDTVPGETTPTEATPTEATPTDATEWTSAGATPADTTRTEATPADAMPTEAVPTEATPTETSSTEAGQTTTGKVTDEPAPVMEPKLVRTFEDIQVTDEEKRRAAAGRQAAVAEEQQMSGRIRGLQMLMEKEEQLLAQRMAYAAKLREKGLAANDQKLLNQAEQFERASLAEYLKKVQQFERASVTSGAPDQLRRGPQQPRTSKSPSAPRSR